MDRQLFIDKLFLAAKEAGIDECEAYFAMSDDFSVEVLEGQIKEYSAAITSGVCLRGVYNGKMGYASSEEMDEDAIEMLVHSVKENAMLIETDDKTTIFEGSEKYQDINNYNEETASVPASVKIQEAIELEKLVKAADPRVIRTEGCSYASMINEKRIVNSKGLDVSFKACVLGAVAVPIVSENGKVNYAFDMKYAFDKKDVDIKKVAENAVKEALSGLNASPVPSGEYKTIFRNDVAAGLLATFSSVFSAESARKGLSLLKGREGEVIASENVTIIDDPLMEGGFASCPFDAEGVATKTKTVIENGTLNTLLHNRTTAEAMGKETTGNASKGGYAAPVLVAPTNFYLKPGDKDFDKLVEEVGDGLLITSLMGMHSGANQISGDFSLGAKGFRIEGGKVTTPVEQITVADNFFELLKKIACVASDLEFRPGISTAIGAPSFYVEKIAVAGK